jgi:hypothetical protein
MGLPIHGSQNMNHIRLLNKLNYVKFRYRYLLQSLNKSRENHFSNTKRLKLCLKNISHKKKNIHKNNVHKNLKLSLPMKSSSSDSMFRVQNYNINRLNNSFPIISNMPYIHLNSSVILINSSPFALTDRRFGILHHSSPSISYF